jgi:nucleotidyltransferase/DNA polymerase involved in DNA repair
MDAFYASVEQCNDAKLRGTLVVVAWKGRRSVVCAASYEARTLDVRSAMPTITAGRLCPEALFMAPDFSWYKSISLAVREIFERPLRTRPEWPRQHESQRWSARKFAWNLTHRFGRCGAQ